MRIGIDGSCLSNRRGFGRFARQTLRALASAGSAHEFVVVVDRPSLETVAVPPGCEIVAVDVAEAPSRAASSGGRRRIVDMLAMGRAAARSHLELMYFPASYSFFPVWNVGRVVVTLHDTLALAHPELVFPTWRGRMAWRVKERLAVQWADLVMTVSETSRRDLSRWFGLPRERVRVMTEGPDPVFGPRPLGAYSDATLARHGVDPHGRFLLYVGGISPHKNLPRLVEAYARSGLARDETGLVLVGDTADVFHSNVREVRGAAFACGVADRVVFTGFVPDDDLVYLYNRAEALVQPSLMEGFGLPAVEAMACGRPVVSSEAGSLPEVVGAGGLYFDPTDLDAMAAALRRVIDDPGLRVRLTAGAREQARRFTWEASARMLLEALDELVVERARREEAPIARTGPWRRSA